MDAAMEGVEGSASIPADSTSLATSPATSPPATASAGASSASAGAGGGAAESDDPALRYPDASKPFAECFRDGVRYERAAGNAGGGAAGILVFHPTLAQMADFPEFVRYMELQGAHLGGIAKVVPPPEYSAREDGYDGGVLKRLMVKRPIEQVVSGRNGKYQFFNVEQRSMKVPKFERLANNKHHSPPSETVDDADKAEERFWKSLTFSGAIYGADIEGSVFDHDATVWNVSRLGTILDAMRQEGTRSIQGVNTAYLYFGMWKAAFCWHKEDMDLYSINYIHFGAPKTWYSIPMASSRKFESCMERCGCGVWQFLRHKELLISPVALSDAGIPCNKVQRDRAQRGRVYCDVSRGYHAGFNHGFNCAESTNFASLRWIDVGKRADYCRCRNDSVHIDMNIFIRKFQPDQYVEPAEPDSPHAAAAEGDSQGRTAEDSSGASSNGPRHKKRRRVDKAPVKQRLPIQPNSWPELQALNAKASVIEGKPGLQRCAVCNEPGLPYPNSATAIVGEMQADDLYRIVTCSKCSVAVHRGCYGVIEDIGKLADWRCTSCTVNPKIVECVLCPNWIGALKPTNRKKWCHVSCALWVPEVTFRDTIILDPIESIDKIPRSRWNLTCQLCHEVAGKKDYRAAGAPIQCISDECTLAYHVTCAQHEGLFLRLSRSPKLPCELYCPKHVPPTGQQCASSVEIESGDSVVCREGDKFSFGVVAALETRAMCEVRFDDGSFSSCLEPEFLRPDKVADKVVVMPNPYFGPNTVAVASKFVPGDRVRVQWTDGKEYAACFLAAVDVQYLRVRFEDETTEDYERFNVFTPQEYALIAEGNALKQRHG